MNRSEVLSGRYAASNERDVVLFLVGMRFNGVRGLVNAVRTFFRMPAMIEEILKNPELGCLGMQTYFSLRGPVVVQYWRSFDDLERYARSDEFQHRGAWGWYNGLGRAATGGGVWHETYRVPAGAYEGIAVNMPRIGLGAALGSERAGTARASARRRLGLEYAATV